MICRLETHQFQPPPLKLKRHNSLVGDSRCKSPGANFCSPPNDGFESVAAVRPPIWRDAKRLIPTARPAYAAGGAVNGPGGAEGGAALPIAAAIVLKLAIVAPSCIVSTAVLGTMTIVALSRFSPS